MKRVLDFFRNFICSLKSPFLSSLSSNKANFERSLLFILLLFIQTCHANYKYELAACVLFQNEAPYLKEWIEFHKMMGVQHFYFFNHYSTDHYLEVLKPYIEEGSVELRNILTVTQDLKSYYSMQCKCYTECLSYTKGICKWVMFTDPDEFLFPVQECSLLDFLKGYERFGGVAVNWVLFGTSYVKKIPNDKLLIETLTSCAETSFDRNRYVKSIVRPERVSHFESAHQPTYLDEYFGVNTDKFPFDGDQSDCVRVNKLRINHYWTRDEDFFYKIKMPRQKIWGGQPCPEQIFKLMNAKKDETILKYVPELKKRVGHPPG